jgi:membrane protease YdiL (CAAX protease family)
VTAAKHAAEEDWEYDGDFASVEESEASSSPGAWSAARLSGEGHQRSLALGLLAMLPMLLAYELALEAEPGLLRNHCELALFRAFSPLGDRLADVRRLVLVGTVIIAGALCFRRRIALAPSLARVFLEGLAGAVLLGPALAFGVRLFGGIPETIAGPPIDPGLVLAGRVFGGAAYEELLFRVLLYGGVFFLARRVAIFFGIGERAAPWVAEVLALLTSALVFAGAHIAAWNSWLGPGGEPFSTPVFIWRVLAGILLALLFRWRGPGVAAWTHGLFNLALLIGAGPQILL